MIQNLDEIDNVHKSICALELATHPEGRIRQLFDKIKLPPILVVTIPQNKTIIRARKGINYTAIQKLSFPQDNQCEHYSRCNVPNSAMFYGSMIPVGAKISEKENRLTALCELSNIFWNDEIQFGEEKYTFSKWIVKESFNAYFIGYDKEFASVNDFNKSVYNRFLSSIQKLSTHEINIIKDFAESLTKWFRHKVDSSNYYHYLLTGIFTDIHCKKKFDQTHIGAIQYPSSKHPKLNAYNIAINPELFNQKKIIPVGAVECTYYKSGKEHFIDNEKECYLEGNEILDFVDVPQESHEGKENVMKYFQSKRNSNL